MEILCFNLAFFYNLDGEANDSELHGSNHSLIVINDSVVTYYLDCLLNLFEPKLVQMTNT
jgi:hypothetical protein